MGLVPPLAEGGREGRVFALIGAGNFETLIGKVDEYWTEGVGDSIQEDVLERDGISTLDDVRERFDCGDRPPEGVFKSIKSGSSTNSPESMGSFCSSIGFDLSMAGDGMGVVAVLLRPDIFLMISMLFFFTIPVLVATPPPVEGSAGNPQICRATLKRSLSFLRSGAFG